jgi:Rod binding domain-containing protein
MPGGDLNVGAVAGAEAAKASAKPTRQAADSARAKKACAEFESILIYNMLSTMRRAFASEEEGGDGFGSDIFKSMMDEQLSLALARAGGMGLAKVLQSGLGLDQADEGPRAVKRGLALESAIGGRGGKQAHKSLEALGHRILGQLRRYDSTVRAAAKAFDLSADLIRAVIMQESAGNSEAVSPKGAKGLMQLIDATSRAMGVADPFDPVQNIFGGARFLSGLLRELDGDLDLALASYNAGPGTVRKYGGIPPFRETRDYIERINRNLEALRASGETASPF